jgi:hypothetical protein
MRAVCDGGWRGGCGRLVIMQGDSGDSGTVKRPRRRWGRWIGFSLLGLIALLITGHAFWGWWEEKKLAEEVEELRRKGEPVLAEELANRPVADADNAVILLREAGRSIDENGEPWQEFDRMVLGLPLTAKEVGVVRRVVEENRSALAKLRQARGKKGVDWQMRHSRSALTSELRDNKEQKLLGQLAAAAILLEHQTGNDREAVELALDLLAQSDAVEQMPVGLIAHLVGIGISALACDRVYEITPDLRVGMKEGEVAPADVKKLIDAFLEESSLREGERRAMRVERAGQVQAARTMYKVDEKGKVGPGQSADAKTPFMGYLVKPLFLRDGRVMLRHATELMAASEAGAWPVFKIRAKESLERMSRVRESVKLHTLAIILTAPYEPVVERTFRTITDRRLAAAALAIRLLFVEQGQWPKSLDELMPRYLPAVPADGMATAKRIGYVAEADRPRVYSVGENGTDEGGSDKPLPRKVYNVGRYRWWDEDAVVDLKRQERKKDVEEKEEQ